MQLLYSYSDDFVGLYLVDLPEGTQREATDTGTTSHGEIMSRTEINKSLRDGLPLCLLC